MGEFLFTFDERLEEGGVNLEGEGRGERMFWSKALRWGVHLVCGRNSRERLVELSRGEQEVGNQFRAGTLCWAKRGLGFTPSEKESFSGFGSPVTQDLSYFLNESL